MIDVNAINAMDHKLRVTIDKFPDECPICRRGVAPKYIQAFYIGKEDSDLMQIVYRCPRYECQNIFIGNYANVSGEYFLDYLAPLEVALREFDEVIKETSQDFCEIYNEAHSAEQMGLKNVCGVGYRKALEFLIKDYAIDHNRDKEKEIRETYLGTCIKDYVDDSRIQECAQLAAWLGNDEAHYLRKWVDKDIEDLKILIDLTVNWIENVKLTEKYKEDMKGKK